MAPSVLFSCSVVSDFATPWTAACQVSLSITNTWSLLKLMSIESVMPSNHFILCHPLLLLPSVFPRIRVFSIKSVLHIRWPDTGTGLYQTAIYHLYSSKSHMRCLRLLLCVFSYCSWGSQGKNTEVVCHSLLEQITFCQTSPP